MFDIQAQKLLNIFTDVLHLINVVVRTYTVNTKRRSDTKTKQIKNLSNNKRVT